MLVRLMFQGTIIAPDFRLQLMHILSHLSMFVYYYGHKWCPAQMPGQTKEKAPALLRLFLW